MVVAAPHLVSALVLLDGQEGVVKHVSFVYMILPSSD